jgi:hypothetical protein
MKNFFQFLILSFFAFGLIVLVSGRADVLTNFFKKEKLETKNEVKIEIPVVKKIEEPEWLTAQASFYDPLDSTQTKSNVDGIGASNREIKSGSIALGSTFAEQYVKAGIEVYIEICNLGIDIMTPYGKNIFRVDDLMAKQFRNKVGKCYLDFFHGDLTAEYKRLGRFDVKFRVIKIENKQLV